jgi:hypothetical protein
MPNNPPNSGPIQQSETQVDNYRVRPEWFEIQSWDTTQSVGGQGENDAEAQVRSREKFNQGSTRASGNVANAAKPRTP